MLNLHDNTRQTSDTRMSEKGQSNKDKRLEEIEKQRIELERSLAVAKVKEAHKQIEDAEKSRKRSAVLSICKRIENFSGMALAVLRNLIDICKQIPNPPIDIATANIQDFERMYVSIIYDFQKTLDIGDEAMGKMFPRLEFRKETLSHAIDDLESVCFQLRQMEVYCERLLV